MICIRHGIQDLDRFSAEINWGDEGESGFFNPDKLDGKIDSPDKLYDASNLLNDDTQKILLPYIKETEHY